MSKVWWLSFLWKLRKFLGFVISAFATGSFITFVKETPGALLLLWQFGKQHLKLNFRSVFFLDLLNSKVGSSTVTAAPVWIFRDVVVGSIKRRRRFLVVEVIWLNVEDVKLEVEEVFDDDDCDDDCDDGCDNDVELEIKIDVDEEGCDEVELLFWCNVAEDAKLEMGVEVDDDEVER